MVVFPNCKINIGLNVMGKRSDGFHDLQSIFFPIPFCDSLEIIPSTEYSFETHGLPIPGELNDNLVTRAYELIKERFDIPPVSISLLKNIPMGGGLGGGSSNGAFALSALNELFDLNIHSRDLESMSAQLGSDCPFFIKNEASYVTGRGERLEPLNLDLSEKTIVLVLSPVHISTKEAFSGLTFKEGHANLMNEIKRPIEFWKENIRNDFEETIFTVHPHLAEIKKCLYNAGALYASMTGTGSTLYGVFRSKASDIDLDLPPGTKSITVST